MKTVTTTATLGDNESLEVSKRRTQPPLPLFTAIGRGGISKHGITGLNAPEIFKSLPGKSAWIFWTLVQFRNVDTNICNTSDLPLNNTERNRIPRAYGDLKKYKLALRVANGRYLINPKVILPLNTEFEKVWKAWTKECAKNGLPPE